MADYRPAEINMLREVVGEGQEIAAALSAELAAAQAALAADPLRALLADEDRAVELLWKVIYKSSPDINIRWADARSAAVAVLAALREVAGL